VIAAVREAIGKVWSAWTTVGLGLAVAGMGYVAEHPEVLTPEVKRVVFWVGLLVVLTRPFTPPKV
jgi:hypothetical protein